MLFEDRETMQEALIRCDVRRENSNVLVVYMTVLWASADCEHDKRIEVEELAFLKSGERTRQATYCLDCFNA